MSELEHLLEKLQEYAKGDIYPYHMPGHKRKGWGTLPEELYETDITEIEGFDNLHQPEGILLELQKKASHLYGAEESFYLVNGSTSGILAAVSCVLPPGGHILMARNCHKSAYHAAYLRNLTISYVHPPCLAEFDILEAVTPKQIQAALEREHDIGAVLIVSPTYEGRIANVRGIADIVHQKGIPLIVDEAHGAHLGLTERGPRNSCQTGADLVIHSVHKTLPALTQTALLHVNGTMVDRNLLKRFLHIYQTSSPSYLLMASIDNALQYIESEGEKAFRRFWKQYGDMMEALSGCSHLRFLPMDQDRQDTGKLLISVKDTDITGKQLYDILLQKYHLQAEMASESFVLAMFTINDEEEAYRRMTEALLEIDSVLGESIVSGARAGKTAATTQETIPGKHPAATTQEPIPGTRAAATTQETIPGTSAAATSQDAILGTCPAASSRNAAAGGQPEVSSHGMAAEARPDVIPLSAAWDMAVESVALEDSVGRYAGEFVNLYPPGVPLLAPGERITEKLCQNILEYVMQGLSVQGVDIPYGINRSDHGIIPANTPLDTDVPECRASLGKKILIKVIR